MEKVKEGVLISEDDPYMEKYGYLEHDIKHCYETIKYAEEIKKDSKKMAAINEYAQEEIGEAEQVIDSLESQEKALDKLLSKQGSRDVHYTKKTPDNVDDNDEEE